VAGISLRGQFPRSFCLHLRRTYRRVLFKAAFREAANGDASEHEEDGKELQRVAGFGGFDGEQESAAHQDEREHRFPKAGSEPKGKRGQHEVEGVQRRVEPTEKGFPVVVRVDPPVEVDVEVFNARAEDHVDDSPQREPEVVAEAMRC